nr:hypothetical protein [Providencia rettgeri]
MNTLFKKHVGYLGLQLVGYSLLSLAFSHTLRAETITIGKGTGILWEGMAFNESLGPAPLQSSWLFPTNGLLAITDDIWNCMNSPMLKNIGGYMALPLSEKGTGLPTGVGLIPRANVNVVYYPRVGGAQTISGTIGLPDTIGFSSIINGNVTPVSDKSWCLSPKMQSEQFFIQQANLVLQLLQELGYWLLMVLNGQQLQGSQRCILVVTLILPLVI